MSQKTITKTEEKTTSHRGRCIMCDRWSDDLQPIGGGEYTTKLLECPLCRDLNKKRELVGARGRIMNFIRKHPGLGCRELSEFCENFDQQAFNDLSRSNEIVCVRFAIGHGVHEIDGGGWYPRSMTGAEIAAHISKKLADELLLRCKV